MDTIRTITRILQQLLFYLFLIFLVSSCAQKTPTRPGGLPQGSGKLVLEISGLRNDAGELFISLFSGRHGFPEDPQAAILNIHREINNRVCRVEIDPLAYGEYAISMFHDEDRDGEMKSNLLGIPKEGFAFSGNRSTKKGQPDYDDVKFLFLVPEKTLRIVMQYETVGRDRQRIMQEKKSRD
ncbi:MAG: hypothetical protein C0623_05375 [Desulfuromonas sp.]|nr:MAG: hypothetical protein C0623_05375 [Desulfuromonas sp.]